ncbi:MAG: M23 family metallopeptidase [Treponema sp.]|nr:M23 family metallopeptidase [Treponema sp.]
MRRVFLWFSLALTLVFTGCASLGSSGSAGGTDTEENMAEEFINPLKNVKFYLTSQFGPRIDPISRVPSNHNGIDMAVATGTPVYAVKSGVVEVSGWHNRYGNYIIVRHEGNYKSLYAHLSRLLTNKGDRVEQGEKIGLVGTTGYSTGPHLHLTMYKNGNLVDPLTLVLKNVEFEALLYPGRKIAQMHLIHATKFKIQHYPVNNVDMDIYFVTKDKSLVNNTIVNYSACFESGYTDYHPLSLSIECGGERFELMDISLLYTETSNDSKLSASFTSALSSKQMGALLSHNDKDKIYIIAKYGDNKEQKIYSKEFNKKISDARQIFVKS